MCYIICFNNDEKLFGSFSTYRDFLCQGLSSNMVYYTLYKQTLSLNMLQVMQVYFFFHVTYLEIVNFT